MTIVNKLISENGHISNKKSSYKPQLFFCFELQFGVKSNVKCVYGYIVTIYVYVFCVIYRYIATRIFMVKVDFVNMY